MQPTLTPKLFQAAGFRTDGEEEFATPPVGFWRDTGRRLRHNWVAMISLAIILVIIVMAFVGPLFTPYNYFAQHYDVQYQTPNATYWFGTDNFGRSMWDRVWTGTRVSLYIAFIAAALDLGIGMFYGAISGYFGGKIDNIMQRFMEIVIGIPNLVALILMLMVFEPGIMTISLALVVTGWTSSARLIRGQVLQIKQQEFFLASRVLGTSSMRLILRHLIPNVLYLVIITLMFTVPSAIFFEAFLSFIGLGITPPDASLGSLINLGAEKMQYYPYLLLIPAAVLCLLTIAFRLLGDALRDALDPKMRR